MCREEWETIQHLGKCLEVSEGTRKIEDKMTMEAEESGWQQY